MIRNFPKNKLKKDGTISHQGEWGGKPPIFKDEKAFQKGIESYISYCSQNEKMPNIAGFAYFNKMGRETYYEYARRYPHTKRVFESFIESEWVSRLSGTGATGAIFYLKNAFREHYKDRTETDVTTQGEKITDSSLDVEALAIKMAKELKKKKV